MLKKNMICGTILALSLMLILSGVVFGEPNDFKYERGLVVPDDWPEDAEFDDMGLGDLSEIELQMVAETLPDSFDWRNVLGSKTPDISYQDGPVCWAHAATGVFEYVIAIEEDVKVDLSEKWLVCINGCAGNMYDKAFGDMSVIKWPNPDFLDQYGDYGAVSGSVLPGGCYGGGCNDGPFEHPYWLSGYTSIGFMNDPTVEQIKTAIYNYGPVACGVYAGQNWDGYYGGVFGGSDCQTGEINHGVVLIGWDDNYGANGVWILKNSWGDNWGEGGYMRIEYGCSYVGRYARYIEYDESKNVHNKDKDEWYDTIVDAVAGAAENDEIIVYGGGTYDSFDFSGKSVKIRSVEPSNPLSVEGTIFNANGGAYGVRLDDGELSGFTVTGASDYGIEVHGTATPTISNCVVEDNINTGIYVIENTNPILSDNIISNNGGDGVYLTGNSNTTITSCVIKLNDLAGIYHETESGDSSLADIRYCIVRDNYEGILCDGLGTSSETIKSNFIYDNVWGLRFLNGTADVINNTVVDNTAGGVYSSTGNTSVTNCIVYNNTVDLDGCGSSYSWLTEDGKPNFEDYENDDFHIGYFSPCVNAGDPEYIPEEGETDIDGQERVYDDVIDIGADEALLGAVYNIDQDEWYTNIQEAINDSNENDEIMVYPGTYEQVDFGDKSITVRSSNPDNLDIVKSTIIDADGGSCGARFGSCTSVFTGFTVKGASATGSSIMCNQEDCNPVISHCILKESGCGIRVGPLTSAPTIENNLIYDNTNGVGLYSKTIPYGYASGILRNNTIANNEEDGIYVSKFPSAAPDPTTEIRNCIIWGNGNSISDEECSNPPLDVKYSCVGGGYEGEGNIDEDPCFVDAANNDYHLELNSPCVNAGDPNFVADANETDIDGQERVLEGRIDIGADEVLRVIFNITQDKCYATIQEAIDDSYEGDEIVVYPGTYEKVDFTGKSITVRSSDPNNLDIVKATIIDADPWNYGALFGSCTSVFTGFTVINGAVANINCLGASAPIISHCIVKEGNQGIRVKGGETPTIENNLICDNTTGVNLIRMANSPGGTMSNNIIVNNEEDGISVTGGGTVTPTTEIRNCIIWGNGNSISDEEYGDALDVKYSCVEGGYEGEGNIDGDPFFVGRTTEWPTTGDLIAYWELDETSGLIAEDSSGNNNDGTLTNMSGDEWTPGQIGGSLEFDGDNDYVDTSIASDIASNLTFSLWFKSDDVGSIGDDRVEQRFISQAASSSHSRLALGINNNKLAAYWKGIGHNVGEGSTILTAGKWYHSALTYNGSTIKIYLDGDEEDSFSASSVESPSSDTITVACHDDGNRHFDGTLDDARIYDGALTEEEIYELYHDYHLDYDYHLGPNSPCIDVGDSNGSYDGQTDIDGDNRVIDVNGVGDGTVDVDMGGDEYNPGS